MTDVGRIPAQERLHTQPGDEPTVLSSANTALIDRLFLLGDSMPLLERVPHFQLEKLLNAARAEGYGLPVIAPDTERLRAEAADFMQHSTDGACRRMCRVGFNDLTVLLAWAAQFPTNGAK